MGDIYDIAPDGYFDRGPTEGERLTDLERRVRVLEKKMALQNTGQFPQLTTKMTPKKSGSKKPSKKGRGC